MKIEDVTTRNIEPVCPHCEQVLETVYRISDEKGWFQGHYGYCYICSLCRKVLGFADYRT